MDRERIEKTFREHVEAKRIAGAACAVYRQGEEIYRGVFGYADSDFTLPLRYDSVFRLASMTKPITAVAALIARERGAMDIDAPIDTYIPGFFHGGVGKLAACGLEFSAPARQITVRDCLCHASGVASGEVGAYQFALKKKARNLEENVAAWRGSLLDFAPKTKQAYSACVAFELVALAVEKATKTPFGEFLQKEIFQPLGMRDTVYKLSAEQKSRLVEMTKTAHGGGLEKVDFGWSGFDRFEEGYTGGSAGLFSTLNDYSNFACMLAKKGTWKGRKILSEESVALMRTPQHGKEIEGVSEYFNWGLGVRVVQKQNEEQPLPPNSFGWSGAYGTHFWVEPNGEIAAVLMLNKVDVGGSGSPFSSEFEKNVEKVTLEERKR